MIRQIGNHIDLPDDRWATLIGGFVINFSSLEFETYLWIDALKGEKARDEARKMKFWVRRKIIVDAISGLTWSTEEKQQALDLWKRASELAELRNTLLHNPITFKRVSDQDSYPFALLPVREFNKREDEQYEVNLIRYEEKWLAVKELALLARTLHKFIDDGDQRTDS